MNDTQWHELKDLFFAALDVPDPDRSAWMERLPDTSLRAELARLLTDDASTPSLLDASPEALARLIDPENEPAEPIHHVGPYRVLDELGHGGMGTVYLAARMDGGFQQNVALKVVRRGIGAGNLHRRFEQERQILATLNHENIARLLDGGTSETGQPYFVMERIDGMPITTYCDEHRLSVDERLRLFETVCEAVHYAHQNLVVHRDLKPSNIFVTKDGRLKLLDFGIAKLLGGDQPDTLLTQTGGRVFTPAYASPEQLTGGSISTASDVYALGIILYELLTGRRPYTIPQDQDAGSFVKTVEPKRPSTAVTTAGDTDTVGEARSTTPERLRRRLSGDLDTIVLKALRRDPERRYTSVEAFRDDIGRHLEGLPVRARKDTLGYRAHKFVRRHQVGVAAAVLVLLSLTGGLGLAIWQAQEKAQEAAKAEEVKRFVLSLFEQADPEEARGETITARDLVDQGLARIESDLAGQPEVQAEMLGTLGEVYRKLGLYDQAGPLLERALAMRRNLFGGAHPEVATSLNQWAVLRWEQGAYDEAEQRLREALAIRHTTLGEDHPDVAETLNDLGAVLNARGAFEEAEQHERRALAIDRNHYGDEHPEVATDLDNLGVLFYDRGDYATAEQFYREALAMRQQLLGDDHPDVLKTLNNLAVLKWSQGDVDEAEQLHRQILARRRSLYGDDHRYIAVTLDNLASVLREKQMFDDAEQTFLEALTMRQRLFGPEHPQVALSLNNIGVLYYWRRDLEAAVSSMREALGIWRRTLGEEHPNVLTALSNLGAILREQRAYDEAETYLRESLALRRQIHGEEHPAVAVSLNNLAMLQRERGNPEAAEGFFRESLALFRATKPPDDPQVADVLLEFGRMLVEQERAADAEPLLREGLAIRSSKFGEAGGQTAVAMLRLGVCLTHLGHYEKAEPLLTAAAPILDDVYGSEHAFTEQIRTALADLYAAWGRPRPDT